MIDALYPAARIDTGIDAGIDTGIEAGIHTGIDSRTHYRIHSELMRGSVQGRNCSFFSHARPMMPRRALDHESDDTQKGKNQTIAATE